MIKIDELKPILEPLLEGREDSATIIESINGIDREPDPPDFSEREKELNKSWNDRFMKAFFGEKGENMTTEVPKEDSVVDDADDEIDGEDIAITDILTEGDE